MTINGLPIIMKRPGYLDIEDLDMYYEDCVIGGRNAFSIPIRDKSQFAQTIPHQAGDGDLRGAGLSHPLVQKAQARVPRVSCTIGEDMWRDRMRQ